MSELRFSADAAEAVRTLHDDAAQGIEDTAGDLPGDVDGGPAAAVLCSILGDLVAGADELALAHRGTSNVLRLVTDDYQTSEAEAQAMFDALRAGLDAE
jgi:hypothetical protein